MNTDEAVAAERLRVADAVAGLTDEQWVTPSLCTAWTVRDVLAHLTTTTRTTMWQVMRMVIRARGDFDRMTTDEATERAAAFSTTELVEQLRESAASTRRMVGSGPMDPLMDLVIHGQDIARPLGLHHESPPEVVAASLAYVVPNRFMGAPKRLAGVRLVSDTSGWTSGDGPEVHGPDIDLLLVAAGRPSGLAGLSGPGVEVLTSRLAPA